VLGHYLGLAARNIARTKLYAAISIVGLAIGFAAATLIGLYVRDELTYERWLPNSERIYQVSAAIASGFVSGSGPSDLGVWLKSDYPQFEAVARLFRDQVFFAEGDRKFQEQLVWADASVFDVFRLPVAAGNLDGALDRPDSIVLTRRIAEKYFGDVGAAVGKTLLYNGEQPMVVTAVIENLPSSTHLDYISMLAASHAPYSPPAEEDRTPIPIFGGKVWSASSYVLLKPNEPIAPIRESVATMIDRHAPQGVGDSRKASEIWRLVVRPIRAIHLSSNNAAVPDGEMYAAVYSVAAIGLLIMLVASINFVNLLTALGMRRALEVGVRKATGARRSDLFAQFMSESFLYVGVAAVLGIAIAAAALRPLNTFLRRTIDFSMFADLGMVAAAALFLTLVALLAGVYPALVLSSFRPATVTKGGRSARGQAGVRQALVVLQFAILTALLIATAVAYGQMQFGMREALRQNTDPIVVATRTPCSESLKADMLRAPGVVGAACAMQLPQWGFGFGSAIRRRDREPVPMRYLSVDFNLFELYGIKLAAGRHFSPQLGTDSSPPDNVWTAPEALIINETAVRAMGFATPQDAIGEVATFSHLFRMPAAFTPPHDAVIIGVVEDFQIGRVQEPIPPAAFYVDPGNFTVLSLKLDGRATPEALEAIDRIWVERNSPGPLQRFFFEESIENMYRDLRRQATLFSVFAGLAVLVAVLGLVGLAAHAAVSRTKEIGIRKALGGGRSAITRLLLWQFSQPVLLANLIAWPAAYWAMSVWLSGFARRVELEAWIFVGAGALTLAVAVAAVLTHTWRMAGARPVTALRNE
jgi:putative ABC transport system permease protein